MARQYGTNLSGASATIAAAMALGVLSAEVEAECSGRPREAATRTNLWHDASSRTMDEWDDRFFGLLEFLCVFFGCGASPATETPQTELQTRVEMFILHIRGCKPPLGATQSSLDTALAAIEEARLLNAAHPLLPSWLSAELDAVLAELHAQLHPLAPEPEGAPH